MKNFLMVSMVLVFSVMILSGCKKKYKCDCINHSPTTGEEYTISNSYSKKLSKSQASAKQTECEATPDCQFLKDK